MLPLPLAKLRLSGFSFFIPFGHIDADVQMYAGI